MTNIAVAHHHLDTPIPDALKANLDAQQAISASVANTLSECVARFGVLQLDATKAALSESFGAARDFLCASRLPALLGIGDVGSSRQAEARELSERTRAANEEPIRSGEISQSRASRELRELALHQERVKEEERKKIARELHDELGALLTSVKAHISVAQARLAAAGMPEEPALAAASKMADEAVETVRKVILELRPSVLDQLGIWAALEWLAARVVRQNGLECELSIDSDAAACELDSDRSTVLYRIVQEAVTNALRHAGAKRIAIRAARRDGKVEIQICDDGKGMDSARTAGSFGIAGMHERALGIGGDLLITSTLGAGTCVTLQLPLDASHGK